MGGSRRDTPRVSVCAPSPFPPAGQGTDEDIVVSSARAYVAAHNKLVVWKAKQQPQQQEQQQEQAQSAPEGADAAAAAAAAAAAGRGGEKAGKQQGSGKLVAAR